MEDNLLSVQLEQLQKNNANVLQLQQSLSFEQPFLRRDPDGTWFFYLDPQHPEKKYLLVLAECMDDRNAHNPLILLFCILQHFGIKLEEMNQHMLQMLTSVAPLMFQKTANAGPFTLRPVPEHYYRQLALKYSDATVVLAITEHLECGPHGKNNLQAVLKRLEIVDTVYSWRIPNLIPLPLLSKTTQDHSLIVLNSYAKVMDLVAQFADKEDDLELLQTRFLNYELIMKREEELHEQGRWLTELFSTLVEDGKSGKVTRFLELDRGNIQRHNTKTIYSNLETTGLMQYVLDPELFLTDSQYFQIDLLDFAHEENFDELFHEVATGLHYTNAEESGQPTFWYINTYWDQPQKADFLRQFNEEIMSEYNPYAQVVNEAMQAGNLLVFLNEFDKENVLKRLEKIDLER